MSRERERLDEIGKKLKTEIDASSQLHMQQQMGRRQILGPAVGTTLNTITPCAACKLLRRRCAEECPFSPYFSPHEPQKFAAVHKVFGASNVSKLLLEVPVGQRADAANSLVYEANVRLRDPVYGCMGAISTLQQQLQTLQAELNAIRSEILRYKYREAANSLIASISTSVADQLPQAPPTPPPPPPPLPSVVVVSSSSSTSSVSSLYTPPSSAGANFSATIHNNSISYFDQ
ncbi:LOB domain-containing protein 15-like isoform X2 [Nicotiana tabacum]|uniref:LOB domain-containing protein 15-like isoform X2 n=2 Tax=Nicotiana TaxID=4085 RepID=A0A1S4C165_TOBAC|nr:PREDICTED: LOB domain-containing protein 15-like isoform X2 [Nicotiana sylvestris]XP_016494818.1 PREDICTED: LOB domain-containing protein 15-like isoform X2 [Nicotiana tabacum]